MLEFKDVILGAGDERAVSGLSFTVDAGEVVGLAGSSVRVRDSLLEAALGLHAVDGGYVSFDGELMVPGAAQFFRRMVSYVPRDLRLPYATVAEMVEGLGALQANRAETHTKDQLMALWARIGMDPPIYGMPLHEVNGFVLRLILLTAMQLIGKPYMIVAEPLSFDQRGLLPGLLHDAASGGAAVLITGAADELDGKCDRIIDIH
ncbi:MAG: hypothetical protein MSD82_03325 [Prevotella sp.]|nr:hypothetical protein [Prevotella sp.]